MKRRAFLFALLLFALVIVVMVVPATRWNSDINRVNQFRFEIENAASEAGLDPALLAGLIFTESRGHVDAISSAGALGLCQLLPSTADEVAQRIGLGKAPWSPSENIQMGANYLAHVTRPYRDSPQATSLGLLCYRIGPGAASRQIDTAGGPGEWLSGLQADKQSVWGYVDQVTRLQMIFSEQWKALPE